MSCKDASHSQHIWPKAPPCGSDTLTFCIHTCEFICFYCPRNTSLSFDSAHALKKHVQRAHLQKGQYPGIIAKLLQVDINLIPTHANTSHSNDGHQGSPKTSIRKPARKPSKIIAPRDRKPARITIPVDLSLPSAQHLDALYNLLQIKPAFKALFRDFASLHLLKIYNLSKLHSGPPKQTKQPLAATTASFLKLYGPNLWPSDPKLQSHLTKATLSTQPGKFWAFKYGLFGPEHKVDGVPTSTAVVWWRKKLGGRSLSAEESVGLSKLGAIMLAYFAALLDSDEEITTTGGMSEQDILEKIVGKPQSTTSVVPDVDRDSSPDIPLRISTSRSKSKEARPSAVVIFPGLANRWRGSDAGKIFCIREGCHHGRKGSGVIVGCENEKCLVEWFHPEYVGLEGQELKEVEWTCSNCSRGSGAAIAEEEREVGSEVQRLGSTETLLASIRDFVDVDDLEMGNDEQESAAEAGAEASGSLFVSRSPSADDPGDALAIDATGCSSTFPVQAASNAVAITGTEPTQHPAASAVAMLTQPIPTSTEQAAADDTFIATMQSTLSTATTPSPVQIESVLAGLSANFRHDPAAAPEQNDTPMTGMADTEPEENILQTLVAPCDNLSEESQYQQQLLAQMSQDRLRFAWDSSSTGVRRAMQNISRLERSSSFQEPGAGGSRAGCQQDSATIPQRRLDPSEATIPTTGAPWRREALNEDLIPQRTQYRQTSSQLATTAALLQHSSPSPSCQSIARSRQQSLDMPPPPPRFSVPSYSAQAVPIVPSQPLRHPPDSFRQPSVPSQTMPPPPPQPPTRRFVFKPVEPLPFHQCLLPTPESTFDVRATAGRECSEWERARTAYYLQLTRGLGGLPVEEGNPL